MSLRRFAKHSNHLTWSDAFETNRKPAIIDEALRCATTHVEPLNG
jgi:hypothetical protein